ncbi:inner membrane protein [Monoraphidium neglectum]|uniref:Inner membrane protein n=1 Tax=Monoraphidium neglectum TaxID=145388 RepID=A0A0D2K657_9CHLO|nr:inner membrane protein [Monoraphidium neglectum]KIZ05843.1 inner membrane protein [Monoraphidium neglectum]|eukprot:XP_013904862.1 inner membrane protein [Monoraphidium neglectum]
MVKDTRAVTDVEGGNFSPEPSPQPVWSAAIGNPAPLGLLAFGMTTFFLMTVDSLWSSKVFVGSVMGYAFAYGGFAQMVAGVLEQLLKGNTFAGSAFFSYGSFWISWAFFQTMTRLHPDLGFTPDAGFKVGECILRAAWGFLTFGFFVPTLRKNGCLMVVFGSLATTFWLLAGGVYSPTVNHAAGYVGAFCGLSAIYAAFAEIYHESLGVTFPGLKPIRFI